VFKGNCEIWKSGIDTKDFVFDEIEGKAEGEVGRDIEGVSAEVGE
jgi:hypothetical protein